MTTLEIGVKSPILHARKSTLGLTIKPPESRDSLRKTTASKIQSRMPTRNSDIQRFPRIKPDTKAQRNQNIANAFYQGGHSHTLIALAFDVSSSTVSRVIKEAENGE